VAKAVGLRVPASQEQLEKWSTELRKSMKGLGTDEKALIEVLVEVHPDDMPALAKTYQVRQQRSWSTHRSHLLIISLPHSRRECV
jgi:hypothetical protein